MVPGSSMSLCKLTQSNHALHLSCPYLATYAEDIENHCSITQCRRSRIRYSWLQCYCMSSRLLRPLSQARPQYAVSCFGNGWKASILETTLLSQMVIFGAATGFSVIGFEGYENLTPLEDVLWRLWECCLPKLPASIFQLLTLAIITAWVRGL